MEASDSLAASPAVSSDRWSATDLGWSLTLLGTAVGAGVLYLPIGASIGGLWPILLAGALVWPTVYFSHRAYARIVAATHRPGDGMIEAAREYFGYRFGLAISTIYYLLALSIVNLYAISITSEVDALLGSAQRWYDPPRWLVAPLLILPMTAVVWIGERFMIRVASLIVTPLLVMMIGISLMLVPEWENDRIAYLPEGPDFLKALALVAPLFFFSMVFVPAVSTMVLDLRHAGGSPDEIDRRTRRILRASCAGLFLAIVFFVVSVFLTLGPEELETARSRNLSALAIVGQATSSSMVGALAPLIAILAITTSYFGVVCAVREGFRGTLTMALAGPRGKPTLGPGTADRLGLVVLIATTWISAVLQPAVLGLVGVVVAPILTLLVCFLPVYVISRVPGLAHYRGPINLFVVAMGLAVLLAHAVVDWIG